MPSKGTFVDLSGSAVVKPSWTFEVKGGQSQKLLYLIPNFQVVYQTIYKGTIDKFEVLVFMNL